MNQPKFKFGDKVKVKDTDKTFIIDHMRLVFNDMGVQYWGKGGSFSSQVYTEDQLELYQEPKKRKIYAFEDKYGWVEFRSSETIPRNYKGWKRIPEYDIEYPEAT